MPTGFYSHSTYSSLMYMTWLIGFQLVNKSRCQTKRGDQALISTSIKQEFSVKEGQVEYFNIF